MNRCLWHASRWASLKPDIGRVLCERQRLCSTAAIALWEQHSAKRRSDRAILTPPVILLIVGSNQDVGAWRPPFVIIGSLGIVWVVGWLLSVGPNDLPAPEQKAGSHDDGFFVECLTNRRFWTLVPVVVSINLTWQLIRAWLPSFLQEGRGATEKAALLFNSAYYIAADVGCIAAGAAARCG